MHPAHIKELDLNLLKLLDALLDKRGVSLAAERLGIGQPSASRALARLRKALNDPLLVRAPGGYVLTPRAEQLRPDVAAALHALGQVFSPPHFDPATTTRRFRIAATDYGSLAVLNRAVPLLLRTAPALRLDVQPWSESTWEALADGGIDLALYADDPLPAGFAYRTLFTETFACMYRHAHPIGQRGREGSRHSRLSALASYPQAVIAYPAGRSVQYDNLFARRGLTHRRVALSLPYFLAAPWIIADSDLMLVVPARVAACLASLATLDQVAFPSHAADFEYRMVWHERMHRDPGHRWLREMILSSMPVH